MLLGGKKCKKETLQKVSINHSRSLYLEIVVITQSLDSLAWFRTIKGRFLCKFVLIYWNTKIKLKLLYNISISQCADSLSFIALKSEVYNVRWSS